MYYVMLINILSMSRWSAFGIQDVQKLILAQYEGKERLESLDKSSIICINRLEFEYLSAKACPDSAPRGSKL